MTRRLSEQDRRTWFRVARTVRPAAGRSPEIDPDITGPTPTAPAAPVVARAATSPVQPAKPVRKTVSPPADISGERRVRRGQLGIDARLDLHGHTQDAARRELATFIAREQAAGSRCVLVITGKGRTGPGVLRARLRDWLTEGDIRPMIAGHARAHQRHGGEGAVYVLLKAKRGDQNSANK
jgi:DNA-nicking Smr family endonuclease